MKIALVTGANKGIGPATARRLARMRPRRRRRPHHGGGPQAAVRLCREGLSVSNLTMDVTDAASVRAAAGDVPERFAHLDVLVNNAGILPEATHAHPREVLDLAMSEQAYATNVLGPVAVTEAFLPLIRKSPAGRIVNVSSAMGPSTPTGR